MKVLVTGANGFIGSALCPHLSSLGHSVVPVVRRPCGMANEYVVRDETSWERVLAGCDSVVHLAGLAHMKGDRTRDPAEELLRINSRNTERLARHAVKSGVRRFVYVSSIKVNGERTGAHSFKASDDARPEDAYGVSKWEAEKALSRLSYETGLEVVVVRPVLVYGPGVKGNFLRLLRLVHAGTPLPLASVNNRRSFIGIDNLVDLILACVEHPRAAGEVFLAADGEDLSTPDLIRRFARAMEKKNALFPFPVALLRSGARLLRQTSACERLCDSLTVDARKAKALIGWSPRRSVDEGIERMVAWYLESVRRGASNTGGPARQNQ